MRIFLWRHRRKLTWISLPLALAALILQLNGGSDIALPLGGVVVAMMLAREAIDWKCKPSPPDLSDAEKATVRDVRDCADDATAIRMLRTAHPDLGLLEAAVFVREL